MAETNQQQENTGKRNEEPAGVGRTFSDLTERIRSGELKARLHYFLFRTGQEARRSDSLFSRYKKRLFEDWGKWLGISAGLIGLMMFLSPEEFWLWQLPMLFLLTMLAPAVFELPNTLNALFGHTEHQHLVGKVITLTHGITGGKGKTLLEEDQDKEWLVSGPDCVAGTSVRIVTLDSKTLYVAEAEPVSLVAGGI